VGDVTRERAAARYITNFASGNMTVTGDTIGEIRDTGYRDEKVTWE
jgi:hypothetical protein